MRELFADPKAKVVAAVAVVAIALLARGLVGGGEAPAAPVVAAAALPGPASTLPLVATTRPLTTTPPPPASVPADPATTAPGPVSSVPPATSVPPPPPAVPGPTTTTPPAPAPAPPIDWRAILPNPPGGATGHLDQQSADAYGATFTYASTPFESLAEPLRQAFQAKGWTVEDTPGRLELRVTRPEASGTVPIGPGPTGSGSARVIYQVHRA